jgi:hypothetical protein
LPVGVPWTVTAFPDNASPNWSLMTTVIAVWVSPSAGEVVAWAVMVEADADGDPLANVTTGIDVRVTPSVVSFAVNVTSSATESVTKNDTWPFAPVAVADGAPIIAVVEDDVRVTAFPATGLLVDVSSVTTATVPAAPSEAGDGAETVD